MNGKRSGSLLRFGLAAVLACGGVAPPPIAPPGGQNPRTPPPATAFATPEGKSTETPPHRGI